MHMEEARTRARHIHTGEAHPHGGGLTLNNMPKELHNIKFNAM